MKNRIESALRTYEFSEEKNINIVILEIQLIIDEHINYHPSKFKILMSEVFTSPYLLLEHRILLMKKMIKLGLTSPYIPSVVEFIEQALYNHNLEIIQKLTNMGFIIGGENFCCLMTDDYHLPFLHSIRDILQMDSDISRLYIGLSIKCTAWKVLNFLLAHPNLTEFRDIKKRYLLPDVLSVSLGLIKKGEIKYIKYIKILWSLGLQANEDAWLVTLYMVSHGYNEAFSILIKKITNHHLLRGAVQMIIDTKKYKFLYGWNFNQAKYFVRKMIVSKLFTGVKILIETSDITFEDGDQLLFSSWFSNSYKPKKKEFMEIFYFLKNRFPQNYENWKNSSTVSEEEEN
jgi:hypothetical protein